ncbi:MAG: putative Ig domain-containing protein [Candidatus Cyclobacteriaceae bacterium M3_2C_046]
MKKLIFLPLLCIFWISSAQKLIKAEYFIDQYVTQGNGIPLEITDPEDSIAFDFNIDVSNISAGPHILYLRVMDEGGFWSLPYSRLFVRRFNQASNPKIVSYEYVFDDMNQIGSGTEVVLSEPSSMIDHNVHIDVSHLAPGAHVLFMRIKDEAGMQSFLYKQSFIKVDYGPPDPIVAVEYFYVARSGASTAIYTNQEFEPATTLDLTALDFALNASELNYGQKYALHIRLVDSKGCRSQFFLDSLTFREDGMPFVINEIPDQELNIGETIQIEFEYEDFDDPDLADGDTLMFVAKQADGQPLPNWLSFDPALRIFTGKPMAADQKVWQIKLLAFDQGGASASSDFNITVIGDNEPPVANATIEDQTAGIGIAFSLALPQDAFYDPDQDPLTLHMYQADGSELPEWITYDNENLTLSGTPADQDKDTLSLIWIAKDQFDAADTIAFTIIVKENKPPVANIAIEDQEATVGENFSYALPDDAFSDPEQDQLSFSCTRSDGSALPPWLSFDEVSRLLSGLPLPEHLGRLELIMVAQDPYHGTDTIAFGLIVNEVTAIFNNNSNHRLHIFPNPVTDRLFISTSSGKIETGNIYIYQIDGNSMEIYTEIAFNADFITLDLAALKSGIYLLRYQAPEFIIERKFLKK